MFAFYDLETTGTSAAFNQPLQFAAILTNDEFNQIERVDKGSKWQSVKAETRQLYLVNAFRVLLTRARQRMVIFVPESGH